MRLFLYTLLVVVSCALVFGAWRVGALDLAGSGVTTVSTDGTTVVGDGTSGAPIAVKTPLPGAAGGAGVTVSNAPSGAGQCLASTGTTTAAYGSCGSGNMPSLPTNSNQFLLGSAASAAWGTYPSVAVSVKDYGAVTGTNWTTGTINSGSATLSLAGAIDFANGEGIVVQGAGGACTMTAGSAACTGVTSPQPTVTVNGTGAFTESYEIACMDGFTPAGASIPIAHGGVAIAGTARTVANSKKGCLAGCGTDNTIQWTACPDSFAAIYRQDEGAGAYNLIATVDSLSCTGGTCTYYDMNNPEINACWGTPGSGIVCDHSYAPIFAPAVAPTAVQNDNLLTYVASGGGTTTLTLHDNAASTVGASSCDGSQAGSGACGVFHSEDRAFAAATTAAGDGAVYVPTGKFSLFRTWLIKGNLFGNSVNTNGTLPSTWGGSSLFSQVVGNAIQANGSGESLEMAHFGLFSYAIAGENISVPGANAGAFPVFRDINSVGGFRCFGDNDSGTGLSRAFFEGVYTEGCEEAFHVTGSNNIFVNTVARCLGCYTGIDLECGASNNGNGDIIEASNWSTTNTTGTTQYITDRCAGFEIVNTTCSTNATMNLNGNAGAGGVTNINSGTCLPTTAGDPKMLLMSGSVIQPGVYAYNGLPSGNASTNTRALLWATSGTVCVAGNQATSGTSHQCQMRYDVGSGNWLMTGIGTN